MLKLTAANSVETLSFRVPRTRTEFFQDDVRIAFPFVEEESLLTDPLLRVALPTYERGGACTNSNRVVRWREQDR